jgi:single-strand DNA-binding protein
MFNVCILTGPVLTEPKLTFFEGHPDTIFYLGISFGPYKAGVIKVACGHHLAPVAEAHIHRGDRLAVVGFIGRSSRSTAEEWPPDLNRGSHQ